MMEFVFYAPFTVQHDYFCGKICVPILSASRDATKANIWLHIMSLEGVACYSYSFMSNSGILNVHIKLNKS